MHGEGSHAPVFAQLFPAKCTNSSAFSSPHQLGTFRSPEGEYFVEPLHSYKGEHYEEEHTKPHIVYRKSAPKKQTDGEDSACDTSGTVYDVISDKTNVHVHTHRLSCSQTGLLMCAHGA